MTAEEPGPGRYAPTPGAYDEIFDDAGLPRAGLAQLDAALAQGPDLVSIVGGGNDILRPSVDLTEVADRLEAAVVQARAAGADVLLATPTDPRDAGLLSALRTRQAVHTANVLTIAGRHGAYVLNQWGMAWLRDWRMWGVDRIHPSPEAHRRLALEAMALSLRLEPRSAG